MNGMNFGGAHIVSAFDEDIERLYGAFEAMRALAVDMLARSVTALLAGDTAEADKIVAEDAELDRMQATLESDVVSVMARRSPVADDLRMIVVLIKLSAIMERVGDHAKNIAKRTAQFRDMELEGELRIVRRMVDLAIEQITVSARAFVTRDPEGITHVDALDDELDDLFDELIASLTSRVEETQGDIPSALHLMFVGKQIERAGDHGVSIARAARYIATGEHPREQKDAAPATSG